MTIRNFIRQHRSVLLSTILLAVVPVSGTAFAQAWPTKNITVIVPLGAGSGSDIMARVVMSELSKQVGQTVVIENRPGAGGTIGANMVAKSAPDGHTILSYGALGSAHALHSKLPYDTLKDFTPVIPFGQQPLMIVTSAAKGHKTLADLIAAGKAKPGSLNYTSAGVGSSSHFGAERLLAAAGIKAQHIPYKGASEAVTEVVSGRADFSVQLVTTTISLIRGGELRPLAVSSTKRASIVPDVPTTLEAGLTGDSIYNFYSGLFMPSQTPRAIVVRFHEEAAKAMQTPAVQERFKQLGVEAMPMTIEQFAKFFQEDVEANIQLVKAAGIQQQQQ